MDKQYWEGLTEDHFVPDGIFRFQVIDGDTHQRRNIDLSLLGLTQFMIELKKQKLRSMRSSFGFISEYRCDPTKPPPVNEGSYDSLPPQLLIMGNTTHIVESEHMLQILTYESGWQTQRVGMLRVLYAPYTLVCHVPAPPGVQGNANGMIPRLETKLRIQYICFLTLSQKSYASIELLDHHMGERDIPKAVVEQIIEYGLKRKQEEDENQQDPSKRKKPDDQTGHESDYHMDSPASHTQSTNSAKPMPHFTVPRVLSFQYNRILSEFGFPRDTMSFFNVRARPALLTVDHGQCYKNARAYRYPYFRPESTVSSHARVSSRG